VVAGSEILSSERKEPRGSIRMAGQPKDAGRCLWMLARLGLQIFN
jgi:hypothetical protein